MCYFLATTEKQAILTSSILIQLAVINSYQRISFAFFLTWIAESWTQILNLEIQTKPDQTGFKSEKPNLKEINSLNQRLGFSEFGLNFNLVSDRY